MKCDLISLRIRKKRSIRIGIGISIFVLIIVFYIHYGLNSNLDPYETILHYRHNQTGQNLTRILCLIFTSANTLLTRARAVHETWASRCDKYYFICEIIPKNLTHNEIQLIKSMPIASINNTLPGYNHLTLKSRLSFHFAYEHHQNDFDWFVKADDDTYLIVENLKLFLSKQNKSEPITFGYNFKPYVPNGYHSGGASYVLSREALRRFYLSNNDSKSQCQEDGGSEDIEIAKCLRSVGVLLGKSIDQHKHERFHPLNLNDHFFGRVPDWLGQYAENQPLFGYDCCSEETISFHYVSADEQYKMDRIRYGARSLIA
ncbi:unnamed protein product [Rotaria sordida]|uniref:N-acetylgalactosaminide beta-1,3-galactosyltransferase n=2 Tax=Rotaria sordida TaxID=392033 RepID=A0A820AE45_9BILA|nr:unnamed protein product [Rotaria sordida]